MGRQIFINQMQCNFNLRQPKANKPTNIYLVVYLNNKQVKLSTGVKVYPEHWNIRKQQAYVNARLSKLDNNNNTIANDRLSELKDMFLEFKHYLCEHPTDIDNSITILRTRIYKNTMTTEIKKKSATTVMKEIIDAKQAASSTKEQQKLNVGKFERYLKENNISDTWESMNLNTFEGYQKYLVDNGRGSVTIRNIIQNTLFPLLKKVSKRVDIPFTWYDSNLNSFEFVKDESNKELASNKKVTLTEEQLKQLYDYPITGTELQVRKRTEIRDLFVLQCLVGQRVGDMQKFFNGDNEKDEEEDTISIIQQKTKARAIIPLTPLAKEIISKYQNTELKYYKPSNSNLNAELRIIAEEAGLNTPVTFEDKDGKQVKPLFELVHTHTARHTFITIMCRRDIPKETIIIATGHEDTKMIDKVYSHLSNKDKAQKVSTAFKKKLDGDIFSMGKVETNSLNEVKPTNDVTNNITFDTLLDTQFFASKINKAVELQSQVGHLKNGKLCSYDNEITSLISEIEKFSQSSTPDSDVAKQYVKQLSVGKQSDLYDSFREMIIKCVKIGISKDAIMQFINKALEIGLLDKERFTNIKEITTALLDKRNQG
ncbi:MULTISPECIES: site-specific integrase [Bacteroides]|jgi:integrase|uniref:site-specific integrase n=1 Tax=Bacteroides TaxID=816 RepID=UPI0011EDCC3A|nr:MULTISPECIES: site-specific integrase [Bacteroides]KAA0095096.1 integrase [Bacteroides thetaiotaomicron]KAA0105000.1 integrase [Bacteroides thetaiotaomicron]MCI9088618.1 tyrosine-type recombinase/integrase [Bacteroides thetaiotaomicron]